MDHSLMSSQRTAANTCSVGSVCILFRDWPQQIGKLKSSEGTFSSSPTVRYKCVCGGGVLFCPLTNFPTPEKEDMMVPFSSDFSVTIAQDISEWFSSSCMSPLCMSPLADLQHLQLTESSSSLHPWFLACDCRVHGTSHTAGILLRPGTHAQRPGLCPWVGWCDKGGL